MMMMIMMMMMIIIIIIIIIYARSVLPEGFSALRVALASSVAVSHEAGNTAKKQDQTRPFTGHDLA
jgi:hypothetical protein